ncbi:MAG: hypothetical protein K8S54_11740 [Spirochaetia bacterium]|nr:hypothetical protein [Spirochaetia bacterium]
MRSKILILILAVATHCIPDSLSGKKCHASTEASKCFTILYLATCGQNSAGTTSVNGKSTTTPCGYVIEFGALMCKRSCD